jgi:ribosome biogenesis GTPase
MRRGAVAALTGASGVGKSTLLNRLFPELSLSTGEISRKIERGRHTTRHVELFPVRDGGFLADTPGFSLLDFVHFDFFELDDLFDSFREFAPYLGKCRYSDCTHTGEGRSECAIARAVAEGLIPESRHESYRTLYRILKEKTKYRS